MVKKGKAKQAKDLPAKKLDVRKTGQVKGGAVRRTGDNDDSVDLEVQRRR